MKTTILVLAMIFSVNLFSSELGISLDKRHNEIGFSLAFNNFNLYKSQSEDDYTTKNTIGISYVKKYKTELMSFYLEYGIEKRETTSFGSVSYNPFLDSSNKNSQEKDTTSSSTEISTSSKTSLKLGLGLEKDFKINEFFSVNLNVGLENFGLKKEVDFKNSIGFSVSF